MRSLAIIAVYLLARAAAAAEKETIVVFVPASDEACREFVPGVSAEMFLLLGGSGRFRTLSQDDLADSLLMEPAEALAFCNDEPGCVAELGREKGARYVLYGDLKKSFDGKKVIVHLVLVDVPGRKLFSEKFIPAPREGDVAQEAGNGLREMLSLPKSAPKAAAATPETKPKAGEKATPSGSKTVEAEPGDSPPSKKAAPGPVVAASASLPSPPSRWKNPWFWTAFSAGVAALAGGGALGGLAHQKVDEARAAPDQMAGDALLSDARGMALGANICFGVGGAALLGAVLIWILDSPEDPVIAPSVAPAPGGAAALLRLRF
jgi:hypothetical protein